MRGDADTAMIVFSLGIVAAAFAAGALVGIAAAILCGL